MSSRDVIETLIKEEVALFLLENMGIEIEGDELIGDLSADISDSTSEEESDDDSSGEEVDDVIKGSEAAPKRKRVVRKGVLRYKMTCPKGWSWDRHKNICVLPPRSTQIKRSRASKRGSRKRKAFSNRIAKSRSKSMRKLRKPPEFKPFKSKKG